MDALQSLYPPSPPDTPRDLTRPTLSYRLRVIVVLASLLFFVVLYVALVILSAYLVYLSVTYPIGVVNKLTILLKIGLIGCACGLFLFLLKGLFKRQKPETALRVEISERDQPALFAFIRRLCAETRAPFPRHVYLTPDVNAAVFYNSSILSLILPTRKNLLIGLGLVNVLTLSEFKAVLAHEFGHFSQSSMKLSSYVYTSNRIIADMVYARDWLDDWLAQAQRSDYRIAIFAWLFFGVVWLLRKLLEVVFRIINFANSALSRQMEFNADLVAVSVSGSDALIRALARLDFASEALGQAWADLSAAAQQKLYSRNLFFHHTRAAEYLRRQKKEPQLGMPPPLTNDAGQSVQVFQPGDTGVPLMWATHPSNFDREQNAKQRYFRGELDERSAWLLFHDPDAVQAAVTAMLYENHFNLPAKAPLSDPEKVQAFIDDEHAETTYDARYLGLYDVRNIALTDIGELIREVSTPDRGSTSLAEDHAQLYGDELKNRLEGYKGHLRDYYMLNGLESGELILKESTFEFRGKRRQPNEARRLLQTVEKELEDDGRCLAALDRRIFQVHYLMARELGAEVARELEERYRFHVSALAVYKESAAYRPQLDNCLQYLGQNRNLEQGTFQEVLRLFRGAHAALEQGLIRAGNLKLPALKNFSAGEPLGPFLMDRPLIQELHGSENNLDGQWIGGFMEQSTEVCAKLERVLNKSMGGILALQESIAKNWLCGSRAG